MKTNGDHIEGTFKRRCAQDRLTESNFRWKIRYGENDVNLEVKVV